MALDISLRPANSGDGPFAYDVLERTMKAYALETWGHWRESEARAEAYEDVAAGRSQIIQLASRAVGLLRVDRFPTHCELYELFLLPEHQGQGIGSRILRDVLAEAHDLHLPVRLRVMRVNPAQRFYLRHGFSVVSETPDFLMMECAP